MILAALLACTTPDPPCRAETHAWGDADGDGWGDEDLGLVCALAAGQVENGLDCDDADPARNPDAKERCDGVDDDCDGIVDQDLAVRQWYQDQDADGFGFPYPSVLACRSPGGDWVLDDTDCDDGDPDAHPDGIEVCGGGDEDCDGYWDEADDDVDQDSLTEFFLDGDGDGFGDRSRPVRRCRLPPGHVAIGGDCDDTDAAVSPKATEVCNHGLDEDCDDLADDADDSLDLLTATIWYRDRDRDGHGDPATSRAACEQPAGHVASQDDCDDLDRHVFEEVLWRHDDDGDGYGSAPIYGPACHPPDPSYVVGELQDCDDGDDTVHPHADDECDDHVDSDCDGADCNPCTEVVIGLLPTNNPSTSLRGVWDELESDWAQFGDCPVRVIDVSPSSVDNLVGSGATTLWASNPSGSGFQYSPTQIDAIRGFVEGGHGGLITTYLIDYSQNDNSGMADLIGIDAGLLVNTYTACQTTVNNLEPTHPVMHGLPGVFALQSHPYAQVANGPWSGAVLPTAELVAQSGDGLDVMVANDTGSYRGVFLSTLLDSYPPGMDSIRASYNVAYWTSGYDVVP